MVGSCNSSDMTVVEAIARMFGDHGTVQMSGSRGNSSNVPVVIGDSGQCLVGKVTRQCVWQL